MDDCLRCHGMQFEGGIRDLVTPLDTHGPWQSRTRELDESAGDSVPGLPPDAPAGRAAAQAIAARGRIRRSREEIQRPSLALFDRREQAHVAAAQTCRCRRCGTKTRAGQDESGPAPGALLPMPRAAGHAARWGRATTARAWEFTKASVAWRAIRSTGSRRARRAPLPSAAVQLRAGRGEDGHHVRYRQEHAQYPLREVRGLPYQGRAEEEGMILRRQPLLAVAAQQAYAIDSCARLGHAL